MLQALPYREVPNRRPPTLNTYQEGLRPRENWSNQALKKIADRFWVSRDVVAITLEEVEFAPRGFYQRKREEWEQRYARWQPWGRGRNPKKWERKALELGSSGLRALVRIKDRGSLPPLDAVYLLDTKVEKVDEYLNLFRMVLLHD